MGKGLMTLSPFHSDNMLMSSVGMAGLMILLHSFLDAKHTVLGDRHYMMYSLVIAMRPRMLVAVDEDLEPIQVPVRVGQALDTVGQAGKPRSITGFQTHKTPVLLGANERAELASNDYVALSNVLEGVVIMRKKTLEELEAEDD
eukprot:TRINITY_DN66017_c8_g1_i3.p1 TRINITY_DN66017_c8_g1~~TRINITY_DN66017_c8_g1_i3.p1  ORF type:complete len:144 (+),score=86.60 TRINITY_DN66017_c8_g1_i3:507-938(+)